MIELEHVEQEGAGRVRLIGRLGAADSADVAAALVAVLERGDGSLHLDLERLDFLDSSGLSVLASLLKRARRRQGDVVLFNVGTRVRALLELTRLHEIFEMREDEPPRNASGF